jgi:hypothetical protein
MKLVTIEVNAIFRFRYMEKLSTGEGNDEIDRHLCCKTVSASIKA